MGHRLSKIYTRTGDDGTSGMADGRRLAKDDVVFSVMGDVDELNSHLGMILALLDETDESDGHKLPDYADKDKLMAQLTIIQHLLFNIGGEIAMPAFRGIHDQHITWMEQCIDEMNEHLPFLKEFILPKGSQLMCQIHVARTIARRSERHYVTLARHTAMSPCSLAFMNRLSDYLFVLSRFVTPSWHIQETLWRADVLSSFDLSPPKSN